MEIVFEAVADREKPAHTLEEAVMIVGAHAYGVPNRMQSGALE
jgi:hypothetical protein